MAWVDDDPISHAGTDRKANDAARDAQQRRIDHIFDLLERSVMVRRALLGPDPVLGEGVARAGTDQESCNQSSDLVGGTIRGRCWYLELGDGPYGNGSHPAGLGDEQRIGRGLLKPPANTEARSGNAEFAADLLACNDRDGIVRRLSVQRSGTDGQCAR